MSMLPVDEHAPTHKPAVVCFLCGGDDELKLVAGKFVCRDRHTKHHKTPIPFPSRLRFREVS